MSQWDPQELRDLCRKHNLADPSVYLHSFQWRFLRAPFHAQRAQEEWNNLWQLHTLTMDGEEYNTAEFSYEANAEACVQALHATADILAQIVNVAVLKSALEEHQVSIVKVKHRLKKQDTAPEVLTSIRNTLHSQAFRYVDAFCNTIKHRRLIGVSIFGAWGAGLPNRVDLKFKEFEYRSTTYPETPGNVVLNDYREELFALYNLVGLSINDYLRGSGGPQDRLGAAP
jgi:hypothetical protein